MIEFNSNIYNRIQTLNQEVKTKLKRRGVILPSKNNDGSIRIGRYSIYRKKNRYTIKDHRGNVVANNINLPHSAITIANGLALTNYLDPARVEIDIKYGAADLDKQIHRQKATSYIQKQQYDQAEIMLAKSSLAHHRAETYKSAIIKDFEKLLRLDK